MREIKFRAWLHDEGQMVYANDQAVTDGCEVWIFRDNKLIVQVQETVWKEGGGETFERIEYVDCNHVVMQYTGLKDKNGKEIYEGDEIRYRVPYRTTQTHTGDNIPNGSYTEPMEPGIKTREGTIVFDEGCFNFKDHDKDELIPISWTMAEWDLESIKEAISYGRPDRFIFDDPEEGDLQYLITDCAKVETSEQLIEYLSGLEVIGNIYQNAELLTPPLQP